MSILRLPCSFVAVRGDHFNLLLSQRSVQRVTVIVFGANETLRQFISAHCDQCVLHLGVPFG
jgi:hypothetical protein